MSLGWCSGHIADGDSFCRCRRLGAVDLIPPGLKVCYVLSCKLNHKIFKVAWLDVNVVRDSSSRKPYGKKNVRVMILRGISYMQTMTSSQPIPISHHS